MHDFIINNKYKVVIICMALIITILLIIILTNKKPKGQYTTSITLEEYEKYDHYGLKYENDESKIFGVLTEIINKDNLELNIEDGDRKMYIDEDVNDTENIKALLHSCSKIKQIVYSIENDFEIYYIDYLDLHDKRIILSYSSAGTISKTLKKKHKILVVTNELILQTYYLN
ncbi:hypothetical protein SH1V18_20970 [Vallitalea longa]|uniref:Uncharacterized protein n=1 Tax=Vallitalea longa TaxID=2936439 RepID=A0A9W5Y9A2_9FIRM|nr:hypothetical protein [Vallitalea longa]GKX29617.1 hypothetical protein SH1V18_20970 [Vallitalea longa]